MSWNTHPSRRKLLEQAVDAGRSGLKGAQADNLVTQPTTGKRNCQLVFRYIDPDIDRWVLFRHAFLHRRSTAFAVMRPEYRLIPQKRADKKDMRSYNETVWDNDQFGLKAQQVTEDLCRPNRACLY